MHKLYCDDSSLRKTYDDKKRSVFLFGGLLISREDEIELSSIMKSIKRIYTGEDMPFKYNIKDLEDVYINSKKQTDFERIKSESAIWRKQIIQESLSFDYKIFISCIENTQAEKKDQKEIKLDINSFLFSNALMRVGLFVQNRKIDYTQVILDWPDSNASKPFDKEYYYAYNRGTNSNKQKYYSGELKKIGFDQTLYYARSNHSNMLQLADIIIGSIRDWIETELQCREYSIGKELTKLYFPKIYGYPSEILGKGINVSTRNTTFMNEMKQMIDKNVA